jgi:4,5-DOPA dioxygenase extradiol
MIFPDRTPVIFIGHGSPMNALASNSYTGALGKLKELCPAPRAILCISAHWMTEDTRVTYMQQPKTIHDFFGFPPELFAIQYPAPGSPEIAELVCSTVNTPRIIPDDKTWGLDHGTWSVLRHIYPAADIPVVQLSLDMTRPAHYHYHIGQQLASLRDEGILIIGSGNIVHNLRRIDRSTDATPYDWAVEFDNWVRDRLLEKDFDALVNDMTATDAGRLSIPTPEHYLPFLYILGAGGQSEDLQFHYEAMQNASISMRTFSIGA